jgi:hypothetical protein
MTQGVIRRFLIHVLPTGLHRIPTADDRNGSCVTSTAGPNGAA